MVKTNYKFRHALKIKSYVFQKEYFYLKKFKQTQYVNRL